MKRIEEMDIANRSRKDVIFSFFEPLFDKTPSTAQLNSDSLGNVLRDSSRDGVRRAYALLEGFPTWELYTAVDYELRIRGEQ